MLSEVPTVPTGVVLVSSLIAMDDVYKLGKIRQSHKLKNPSFDSNHSETVQLQIERIEVIMERNRSY